MINRYREVILNAGKIINIEKEYIYYLSEGTAHLWELHSDGEEVLINVLRPDDAISLPNEKLEIIYELRTNAKGTKFLIYKHSMVNSLEEKYFLLNKVIKTLMRAETFNLIKRKKFVRERLISLFYFLVQEHGEKHENNNSIIKELFTHEQLASLVLSTRTTVTRILNELKEENIITFHNRHICLIENENNSEQIMIVV